MIKLYDKPECPFCWRVRLALHAVGVEYQRLDYLQEPQNWRRLTPGSTVPVMEDRGMVLFESSVMLEYLQDQFGSLLPVSPEERARARSLMSYADNVLGRAGRDVIFEKRDRDPALWDHDRLRLAEVAWIQAMPWLDEQHQRESSFFGGEYSLADMVLATRFGLAQAYGLLIPEEYGYLKRWFGRISSLPGFLVTAPQVVLEALAGSASLSGVVAGDVQPSEAITVNP
jgi:RNA polymerase-associated protein